MVLSHRMKNVIKVTSTIPELCAMGLRAFENNVIIKYDYHLKNTSEKIVVFDDESVFIVDDNNNLSSFNSIHDLPENTRNALITNLRKKLNK